MSNNEVLNKIDDLNDSVNEIKISQVKQEANLERLNEILETLTDSVVYHVKRTDDLTELIATNKETLEKDFIAELKPIKSHVVFVQGVMWTLGIVGAIIMGLHELGILNKLF